LGRVSWFSRVGSVDGVSYGTLLLWTAASCPKLAKAIGYVIHESFSVNSYGLVALIDPTFV
jgi:hypothetical protein